MSAESSDEFRSKMSPKGDTDEEVTVWEGGYSPKAMLGTWIISGVLSIAALVLGVLFASGVTWWMVVVGLIVLFWIVPACQLLYRRLNVAYKLTSQRFIHQHGVLTRTTDRIEVIDMDDITFRQGIVDRFTGVGTVIITSSDRTHPEIHLYGIEDVKNVSEEMDNARRNERMRRGIHIEAV